MPFILFRPRLGLLFFVKCGIINVNANPKDGGFEGSEKDGKKYFR